MQQILVYIQNRCNVCTFYDGNKGYIFGYVVTVLSMVLQFFALFSEAIIQYKSAVAAADKTKNGNESPIVVAFLMAANDGHSQFQKQRPNRTIGCWLRLISSKSTQSLKSDAFENQSNLQSQTKN